MAWHRKAAGAAVLFGALFLAGVALAQDDGSAPADPHWLSDPRNGCAIFDSDPHPGDMAAWSGDCANGSAQGQGTVVYSNNGKVIQSLSGAFTDGRVQDGMVEIHWGDGSSYQGSELGGEFSGKGVFVTAKGDRLDGTWAHNKLDGYGVVAWANGDRYEGTWKDGQSDGKGVQTWADGRKYDGEWADDKPNGHGILTKKDGTTYEGDFVNGEPADTAQAAATVVAPRPAQLAALDPAAVTGAAAASDDTDKSSAAWAALAPFNGQKLSALDGSSIAVSLSGNTLTREITAPDGKVQASVFSLMNANMGTIADESDASKVTGFFRVGAGGLDAQYADGRSERFLANDGGGVSVASKSNDGQSFCMAWYPQGHVFSEADRKAALAAFAGKLGLNDAAPKAAVSSDCTPPRAQPASQARNSSATPLQPVVVRVSVVHPIDVAGENQPVSSDCLHVESDGTHWGFRNTCGHSVQFAYCMMGSSDPLAACGKNTAPGSVQANGFAALFSDAAPVTSGADRDFRWIACDGAAGEVTAHLDGASPPKGRCVRARSS